MFKWRNRNKNKKKLPAAPARVGEQVTPERQKRQGGVKKEIVDRDATGKVYIEYYKANEECALDHYHRKRKLTERQHAAGMKIRKISAHINNYASSKIALSTFASEAGQIDHEDRMLIHVECVEALDKVYKELTPVQRSVVRNVCGFDIYASSKDDQETLARGLECAADCFAGKKKENKKQRRKKKIE